MQCNESFNQTRNYWQVPGPSYPTSLERGQDGDPNGISISSGSITIGKEVVQWSSNEAWRRTKGEAWIRGVHIPISPSQRGVCLSVGRRSIGSGSWVCLTVMVVKDGWWGGRPFCRQNLCSCQEKKIWPTRATLVWPSWAPPALPLSPLISRWRRSTPQSWRFYLESREIAAGWSQMHSTLVWIWIDRAQCKVQGDAYISRCRAAANPQPSTLTSIPSVHVNYHVDDLYHPVMASRWDMGDTLHHWSP